MRALREYVAVWILNHVVSRLSTPWTVLGWASLETGTFEQYNQLLHAEEED